MPLFRRIILSESASLGIWKITENPEILKKGITLSAEEGKFYQSMNSEMRKKQWLSYRNILSNLIPQEACSFFYDAYGKPQSFNNKYHLSVSHSGHFSAAIVSSSCPVGIDIEMIKDRVERVKEKFLNNEEREQIGITNRIEKLTICWGAKESLYKLYGKPDVDFQKDIAIEPFDYGLDGKGQCFVRMTTPAGTMSFPVRYEKIEEYMLVYSPGSDAVLL